MILSGKGQISARAALRRLGAVLFVALGLGVAGSGAAFAQGAAQAATTGTSGATSSASMAPIPNDAKPAGPVNVHVFGDSLGDGIWAGLYRKLDKKAGYEVIKHSRVSTGLVRKDYYDWSKAVRQITAAARVDVAVVMIGTNDRQTIVEGGKRYALRSPGWEAIYKARIDDMIEVLQAEGAKIYWIELPAMRSPRFASDMQYFNSLFEERARAHGIDFIPTWQRTLGDNGAYSAYGLDENGRNRLMRANDGIHFTMRGYLQLASFVTDEMARDAVRRAEAPEAAPVAAPAEAITVASLRPVVTEEPVAPAPAPAEAPVAAASDPAPAPVKAAAPTPEPIEDLTFTRAGVPLPRSKPVPEGEEARAENGVMSNLASVLSDLRRLVLPEPKPGRADDLSLPAQ